MRIGIAVTGLALYAIVVLAATLSPTPLDAGYDAAIERFLGVLHRNGIPEWFGYSKLEFSANIAMFVPLGFLMALALPRKAVWAAILLIPAFSGAIELFQATFLAARFASVLDVVANTAGGYLGAVLAIVLRAIVDARDRKLIARALWDHGVR
jgi:glycopeptide antibiotics resistance protein